MSLEFNQLSIGYRKRKGVQRVHSNLQGSLKPGSLVCLMGANGAGKSTLLRTLAGLQATLGGEISLDGKPLPSLSAVERARMLSVVLTLPLPGSLRVEELIFLGRHPHTGWLGRPNLHDQEAVAQALRLCGLESLAQRRLETLSDGQRQKALIARALAQDGRILLLDEPTAHLDLPHRLTIMQLLHDIAHQQQKAVLVSTHELDLALQTADQLWLLPEAPDAPLVQGLPEDLLLQNALSTVFPHPGLEFELSSGRFVLARPSRREVNIQGPEPALYWTCQALARYGITASPTAKESLHIYSTANGWLWRIENQDFKSIQELIKTLQHP